MPSAKLRPAGLLGMALLALLGGAGGIQGEPGSISPVLERLFDAQGKVNAPLDLALDPVANRAYLLEADGDVVEARLTPDWQVTSLSPLTSVPQATALSYIPADRALLLAAGAQLVRFDLNAKTKTTRGDLFPGPIAAVAPFDAADSALAATQAGELFRVSLTDGVRTPLGSSGQPLSDALYDPARELIYLSTPRGTLLVFDPATARVKRLAFVGPPLGRLDLDDGRLYVTSIDFGLYSIYLNAPDPKPFLFFPRVAGPTALAVHQGRALVSNVGEGLVLVDPLDLSGPLASTASVIVPPALGPVRSLAIDAARGIALSSDRAYTLWSLHTDPFAIASFVFTPFDGRVILDLERTAFYATNRAGGQVLAMAFDPPFVFSFDQPPISPLIVDGLPQPDGLAHVPAENALYVGTLDDSAVWRVDIARRSARQVARLPGRATAIDVASAEEGLVVLLNSGLGFSTLLSFAPPDGLLEPLAAGLPPARSVAVAGLCAYLAGEDGQLIRMDLRTGRWEVALTLVDLSAVARDGGALYLGTRQGELFRLPLEGRECASSR